MSFSLRNHGKSIRQAWYRQIATTELMTLWIKGIAPIRVPYSLGQLLTELRNLGRSENVRAMARGLTYFTSAKFYGDWWK